jgi:DNA-binding transcriptional MerR regulator/effector-binding domain-containing protein
MEYRIGDFSLIARLPVKTLRYYHEEGILLPSRTDPVTGYRWYDEGSLQRARMVKRLRELDFGIDEIASILRGKGSEDELRAAFLAKAAALEEKLGRYAAAKRGIEAALAEFPEAEEEGAGDAPELVEEPGFLVAAIRFRGAYGDVGPRFERLGQAAGRWLGGPVFTLYHDAEYTEAEADMEACAVLKPEAKAAALPPDLTVRELPPIRAVSAFHRGSYETIGEAYRRLFDFIGSGGFQRATPYREIYLTGPGLLIPRNPKRFLTRILIPLAER